MSVTTKNNQEALVHYTGVTISRLRGAMSLNAFKSLSTDLFFSKNAFFLLFVNDFVIMDFAVILLVKTHGTWKISSLFHLLIVSIPLCNIGILKWNTIKHGNGCWTSDEISFKPIHIRFLLYFLPCDSKAYFLLNCFADRIFHFFEIQLSFKINWIDLL
jgi:hypothetical protein